MSYLQNQMNALRFDKRLLEMNLKSGIITREEYDQFVTDLKDDTGNATQLDLATEAEESQNASQNETRTEEASSEPSQVPTNTDPFGSGF